MGSNIDRLGIGLSDRMKRSAGAAVPTVLELGTVNGDLSISTDSLSTTIPKGSYMVSLTLTHETYFSYNEMNSSAMAPHVHTGGEHGGHESGSGAHTHNTDGLHDHRAPSVFRRLKPGDRVLVAWCGAEPVVIDIVVSSNTITRNE